MAIDLRKEVEDTLELFVGPTARAREDELADRYELTWKTFIAFVSTEKTLRYFRDGRLGELVGSLVRVASEKHPVTPNQPMYSREEVVIELERELRNLLLEAGLPLAYSTGDVSEDRAALFEVIVERLRSVHKESVE